MALTNLTKMANRLGLDIKFYEYDPDGLVGSSPIATIDFANSVSLELSSELTWATGGAKHAKRVGFRNEIEGTLKISSQLINMQILKLAADGDISGASNKVEFKNGGDAVAPKYYIITGETVWQGEDATTYNETITVYKACVKPGYNVTYDGSGDPQSIDIEFELGTNDAGKVVDIERADAATD